MASHLLLSLKVGSLLVYHIQMKMIFPPSPPPTPNCMIFFAGCFFSTAVGELRSFENPNSKITAVPAKEEEICGATYKVR